MSFCKKGFHSFLSFTSLCDTTTTTTTIHSPPHPLHKCQPGSLPIGLASATGDSLRPPNILESTTVGPPLPPVAQPTLFHPVFADGYPLTFGFFEEVGEVVDGLMSCTESLGFESSDERRVDEGERHLGKGGVEGIGGGDLDATKCELSRAKRREENEKMRERKFPPPITSLNDKGRPNFFLRALRRDGRLELAEVRIDRPEILRASRADGRLRLEFVKEEAEDAEDEETEEEWKVAVSSNGEGFGRCHEMVGHGERRHQHHNELHVWRQHYVTIR